MQNSQPIEPIDTSQHDTERVQQALRGLLRLSARWIVRHLSESSQKPAAPQEAETGGDRAEGFGEAVDERS